MFPLEVVYNANPSWSDIVGVDAVFIQRPDSQHAYSICRLAAGLGKRIWIDYDDNLLAVPEYNMSFQSWSPEVVEVIKKICATASVVTVSTPVIKESMEGMNPCIVLLPNAVDFDFYNTYKVERPRTTDEIRIMWRGSDSQSLQLRALAPHVLRSLKEFPNVKWILMCGTTPFQYLRSAPPDRCIWQKWKLIPEVFITMLEYQADIHVSLLFDEVFDRSRSPGALMESIPAGAAFLGPEWWSLPGQTLYTPGDLNVQPLITFSDNELAYASGNFYEKLVELIQKTPEERTALNAETLQFLQDQASLTRAAEFRWRMLVSCLDQTPVTIKLAPKELNLPQHP